MSVFDEMVEQYHPQQLLATAKKVGRNPRDMAERGSCKDGVDNLAEVLLVK